MPPPARTPTPIQTGKAFVLRTYPPPPPGDCYVHVWSTRYTCVLPHLGLGSVPSVRAAAVGLREQC